MWSFIPSLVFVLNGKGSSKDSAAAAPSPCDTLPLVDCNRKLNLLSCFWEAKWFWCLKRLIALKKKWIRCSPGPDPSSGRASRNPFVHPLSLVAVAPGAARLSPLRPSHCVMSLQAWPVKRRGAGYGASEKRSRWPFPLAHSSGLCSLSSWSDWRMVMREQVHEMCLCLSGWQCWQGGII